MIAIIDYGLGNVRALKNIYDRLNITACLAQTERDIENATHLILPGVGAFDWAMQRLQQSGMREVLDYSVKTKCKPVLGICVGMQMMVNSSEEGTSKGLGWIDARVIKLPASSTASGTKLPHMGWNEIDPIMTDGIMANMDASSKFYFLHSYYVAADNGEDVLAWTSYGGRFASAIRKNNVNGVQFHPEKSHGWGVKLLRNFSTVRAQ
jgi:glutamine amidotransferase